MAGTNHCELRGVVTVKKSFPARDGKKALCIASIKPDPHGPYFHLKAFDQAAHDLGNAEGLVVTVVGRLDFDKPKDPKIKPWPMVIVVEKVRENAPDVDF